MSGNTRKSQVARLVTLRHQSTMSGALMFGQETVPAINANIAAHL